jgi:hypothetical protein
MLLLEQLKIEDGRKICTVLLLYNWLPPAAAMAIVAESSEWVIDHQETCMQRLSNNYASTHDTVLFIYSCRWQLAGKQLSSSILLCMLAEKMLLLQCAAEQQLHGTAQVCSWLKQSSMMQARDWQIMLRLIAVSCCCSSSARAAAHGCLSKHPYDTAAQQQDAR